jgi:hypothetical protein
MTYRNLFEVPFKCDSEGKKSLRKVNYLVNNEDQPMTLAGDIPMNSRVQLMMASVDDRRRRIAWRVCHEK